MVYPSIGTLESEFDDVFNFILFVIFCCDGKPERFEDVAEFDVVTGTVDVVTGTVDVEVDVNNDDDDRGGGKLLRAFLINARLLYLTERWYLL